ncbi:glycosyltransferase family 2 protein [Desulfovibrionales bacterium]
MSKLPVTGLVLTLNGERYLQQCLESLRFCDHILVVDSGSQDATQEIARNHGATVLINPWPGPKDQFAFAFRHITTPWVVSLDQDEILSDQLRASIEYALNNPGPYAAFLCPRTSFYFDRFLRHSGWYPDLLPRVFALASTTVHVSGPHYGFSPAGPTLRLHGDILHYPYENLHQHIEKINYYTEIAAKELFHNGKRAGALTALGHGLARFIKVYFLRRGFLDGRAGLVLAVLSLCYAFLKYAKLAELWAQKENSNNQETAD